MYTGHRSDCDAVGLGATLSVAVTVRDYRPWGGSYCTETNTWLENWLSTWAAEKSGPCHEGACECHSYTDGERCDYAIHVPIVEESDVLSVDWPE